MRSLASQVEDDVWTPLGFLSQTKAHQNYYYQVIEDHPDLQLCLIDEDEDRVVALANCVPFHHAGDAADLPQEGWDWLVEAGSQANCKPCNMLGALAISVPDDQRGKGHARRMIAEMKDLAVRRGYRALVGPVRPSAKCHHPLVPMAEYMHWRRGDGTSFDPWIRTHSLQGASIISCCSRSMVVEEHIAFWETWAGHRFDASGQHVIKNALVPIEVDLERQTGLYEEPNVWMGYWL